MSLPIISALVGFLGGAILVFFYQRSKLEAAQAQASVLAANAALEVERRLSPLLSASEARLERCLAELTQTQGRHDALRVAFDLVEGTMKTLENNHFTLKAEFSGLETTLRERDADLLRVRTDLDHSVAALKQLETDHSDLRSVKTAVETNLADREAELVRVRTELDNSENSGRKVASDYHNLRVDHNSVTTTLGERESSLSYLRGELEEAERRLQEWVNKGQELQLHESVLAGRLAEFQSASDKRTRDESDLKEAFRLLAVDALAKSNETFLPLAKKVLEDQQNGASEGVGTMLLPVKELLEKLQEDNQKIEISREGAYSTLLAEIKNVKETHESLRAETHQLVAALRDSGTRGNWGAVQLKRCLEFAGMIEHCDFELEKFVRTEGDEAQRPDCVVSLPQKRTIIIDAKTPMRAFLEATAPGTDEVHRKSLLEQHARQLKTHLMALRAKGYWKQFKESPDFVICFLPHESLLGAALLHDPELILFEDASVLLATPTTLIALMRVIAFGWKQVGLARDAQKIHDLAVSVYDKLSSVHDSFQAIGRGIKSTASSWEKMRTQVEGKGGVFSLGRRLQKLDISKGDLADIAELQMGMHELQADDWKPGPRLLPSLAAGEESIDGEVARAD